MTTAQKIQFYTPQIQQIALFAKRISFDVVNGNIEELARLWYQDCVKLANKIDEDKDEFIRVLKHFM